MYYSSYVYLKNSSYISFFLTNMVDVPVCFKKSISLKRKSFELPILKLFNLLMRKGKREKVLKSFLQKYNNYFFSKHSTQLYNNHEVETNLSVSTKFFLMLNSQFYDLKKFSFLKCLNNCVTGVYQSY